jgi:hypothetical protein
MWIQGRRVLGGLNFNQPSQYAVLVVARLPQCPKRI